MPGWYYEKKELKNTPSALDGIDYATEMRYRKEGARLIINAGKKMVLGCNTVATGVVYYHRFYMFHSFRQFPRYVTACCCLFLAGKVEETPKKCKDIIKTARTLLTDQKFGTFGEDPKEEVMTLERILLQTIKFDLQVEHPYQYLVKYAKCFKGDKSKLEHMVEMAWTFVNDSLCTTLCLQWEPEIIAVALMYLAGKLSKFEVTDWIGRTSKHLRWWDMFVEDVTMDLLEDICHQVLDLYSQNDTDNPPDSPPLSPQKSMKPPQLIGAIRLPNPLPQDKQLLQEQPPQLNSIKAPPPNAEVTAPYPAYPYPAIPPYAISLAPPPAVAAPPPPPHMAPPPGPPPQHIPTFPYVTRPPPFPPVVPSAAPPPFYSATAPPPGAHRPYYPPN